MTDTAGSAPRELARAVLGATPDAPESLRRFEAIARSGALSPDFTEHSVRFGQALHPHRLTHYFDVARGDDARVREVGARFAQLAAVVGRALPADASDLLTAWLSTAPAVAQVVLGIDARDEADATRAKHYTIFGEPAPETIATMCARLGAVVPDAVDLAQVYIVGVDADARGISDVKLYMRLDRARLRRTIRNVAEVEPLVRAARSVVLQQCLSPGGRRQLHFHADDVRVYGAWLDLRADDALRAHVRAVERGIARGRLGPWIIGLAYDEGVLHTGAGNVYFHVEDDPRNAV